MKITVSGEIKEVQAELTVAELIKQENVETPEYISVSVNDDFVKSEDFATHKLQEGDNVEFLYFMGGGSDGIYK
ncbi:MAG: sulfur carrier protein ThiS [Clostridia bacterium]|nr:sulfur carrier protein ThiS [Clostridia bacterium]